MTLKNPFVKFYDSDFDSQNESNIFNDTSDLNIAFIASPDKSISCILDDSSLKDHPGMLVRTDEKDLEKVKDWMVNKFACKRSKELPCQENLLSTDVFRNGLPSESDIEPYSIATPKYLDNEKNWVSTAKRNRMSRFGNLDSEIGNKQFSKISATTDLLKKAEERTECIFTSTYLEEFQKTPGDYDWRKIEKRSFFEMDDESEETEYKIQAPAPQPEYVYHELSTIPEMDSVLMDESVESLLNLDKEHSLFMHDPKVNDSSDVLMKVKASNFPPYIMKVIQNEHIKKFLQEPGILEQSDLTLISTDLDSLSTISEISKKGHCHSYFKCKGLNYEESPSLISFEQHELSCIRDCTDE